MSGVCVVFIRTAVGISLMVWAVFSAQDIGGRVFDAAGGPYRIEQDLVVPSGSVTRITAGAVMLFTPFTGIVVHGRLIVDGSVDAPVIFTSVNDSMYVKAAPQSANAFDWNGILVENDADTVILSRTKLAYSTYGLKTMRKNISIREGRFHQNGQFHVCIGDSILPVLDNTAFSYGMIQGNVSPLKQRSYARPAVLLSSGILLEAMLGVHIWRVQLRSDEMADLPTERSMTIAARQTRYNELKKKKNGAIAGAVFCGVAGLGCITGSVISFRAVKKSRITSLALVPGSDGLGFALSGRF